MDEDLSKGAKAVQKRAKISTQEARKMVDWEQLGIATGGIVGMFGVVTATLKKYDLLHFGKSRQVHTKACPDPDCQSIVKQTHDQVIGLKERVKKQDDSIEITKDDVKKILTSVGYIEGWVKKGANNGGG